MKYLYKKIIHKICFFAFVGVLFFVPYANVKAVTGDVVINEQNFPDAIFREYVKSFDKNNDGSLSEAERNSVTSISIKKKGIETLQGIECFDKLSSLWCSYNSIAKLDLSQNPQINHVEAYGNGMKEINLSGCENLLHLYAATNEIEKMDLTDATSLQSLDCRSNKLKTLVLETNINLEDLYVNDNNLKKIDVSSCPKLVCFECDNNQISVIDIRNNEELETLSFNNNQVKEFLYKEDATLEVLYCSGNGWDKVDISKLQYLSFFTCADNQLTSLDVSSNKRLQSINCSGNQIDKLIIGDLPMMSAIRCDDNRLKELDVSGYPQLETLSCKNNQLKELDVSKNEALKTLDVGQNPLFYMDLTNNGGIREKDFEYTKISLEIFDGKFDLSQVNGMDLTRVSNLQGATLEDGILYPTDQTVKYRYDAGNNIFFWVTIDITNHVHKLSEVAATAATCAKEGNVAYYACACGKNYFDDAGEMEILDLKEVVLPKTDNHEYSSAEVVPASFSTAGKITTVCTVCGKKGKADKIAKLKKMTLSQESYTYNGKKRVPDISVKNSSGQKVSEIYYKISYPNGKGKKVGSYPVKVSFRGMYKGEKIATYKILPKATKVEALKGEKKAFTVRWKKKTEQVDGYKIQYSLSQKFTDGKTKTITIKTNDKTSKTVKGLKTNQRYYVRVCTYKIVAGKNYTSAWSETKSIVVK